MKTSQRLLQRSDRQAEEQLAQDLLHHYERITHADPLIDEVGFVHPMQFCSLGCGRDSDSSPQAPEFQQYFWCREPGTTSLPSPLRSCWSSTALPGTPTTTRENGPSQAAPLMSQTKALLILCPEKLTAWNSRKMVLSEKYDFIKLHDVLQIVCTNPFLLTEEREHMEP